MVQGWSRLLLGKVSRNPEGSSLSRSSLGSNILRILLDAQKRSFKERS